MNQFKKVALLFVLALNTSLVFSNSLAFSDSPSKNTNNSRKEQTYTNGFALSLGTGGSYFAVGYYFGNNNTWEVLYGISPYSSVNNASGIEKDDSWSTYMGAGLANFIPIFRKKMSNKLFIAQGAGWGQKFGKSAANNANIQSSWSLEYDLGLQYRINGNFYLTVVAPVLWYSRTKYSNTPNSVYKTNSTMWTWNVLNPGSVAVTYKF